MSGDLGGFVKCRAFRERRLRHNFTTSHPDLILRFQEARCTSSIYTSDRHLLGMNYGPDTVISTRNRYGDLKTEEEGKEAGP